VSSGQLPFEAGDVFDDEALLDRLAAGSPADDDGLGILLGAWRSELDLAASASPATSRRHLTSASRRDHGRVSRTAISAFAAAALFATGGVAAAAVSGPGGPLGALHRAIFGGQHSSVDAIAQRVSRLLDAVGRRLAAAQAAGFVSEADRTDLSARLHRAAAWLRSDPRAPGALWQQLRTLRDQLAALPASDPPTALVPDPSVTGSPPAARTGAPTPAPDTSSGPSPERGTPSAGHADGPGDGDRSSSPNTGGDPWRLPRR
jgi:hypothetical protein